jgi:hypothetical protein
MPCNGKMCALCFDCKDYVITDTGDDCPDIICLRFPDEDANENDSDRAKSA